MFKALLLENQDGKTIPTLTRLTESQLPEGEVRVAVSYSSINYKDGLAITGKGKIVRQWPLVPASTSPVPCSNPPIAAISPATRWC